MSVVWPRAAVDALPYKSGGPQENQERCERCVTARDVDARYKQDGVKPWAAAKQSTASPTTTRGRFIIMSTKIREDSCDCET